MQGTYLEILTTPVALGGEGFTVAEFSGRDLSRYLAALRAIQQDGANLAGCVDGILAWVLQRDIAWLGIVPIEEKLAIVATLNTLNALNDLAAASEKSSGQQVTWDEACHALGACWGMDPLTVWATYPPRLIRRYYFHALRAQEREHWFWSRMEGNTAPEPRWLHGDPDAADVSKVLKSADWQAMKARHEALRGRRRSAFR